MTTRALDALYPFLSSGRRDGAPGGHDDGALLADATRSTEAKIREVSELRARLGREHAGMLIECARAMAASFGAGGTLLAFGNGGSATDVQAVVQLFLHPPRGRPLPALGLSSDVAVMTALSNDVGFEVVFARQLAALAGAHDIALGISTSGGSVNVLGAFDEAARHGLLTVGLAGSGGGRMAEATTIRHLFIVPSASVHRIQEAQTTLYHVLWELVQTVLEGVES
jgi:D-sedoheptulose 7-phosphate isomerase